MSLSKTTEETNRKIISHTKNTEVPLWLKVKYVFTDQSGNTSEEKKSVEYSQMKSRKSNTGLIRQGSIVEEMVKDMSSW